ncbi:MAG: hypothetical protein A2W00_02355 [Candidatus Eisenbacteria bacterium RBG_16_71_46]|nr:MAG: hypothetical protein A2W00_02355 [Candidatus Eisenbacteria bacterium RBG_16_71_46]
MHFLDSWTELSPLDLGRLLLPAACVALCILLPGRRVARIAAAGVALSVLLLREIGAWPLIAAWSAVWALVAWRAGAATSRTGPASTTRVGGVESGAVGLMLGVALLALLVAAVARQNLSPEDGRRASWGLLVMGLGLLHLMLRRHALRALVAFAALGLGLQMLNGVARSAQVPGTLPAEGRVLLATLIVLALVGRVAWARQCAAGSASVSDAHDLHD